MQQGGEIGIDYLISGGLGSMINSLRNVIFATLETELASLELTSAQFIVVIAAMRGRARTVNEFCAFAGIEAGPMSRLLDRLEAKGIVRRVRDDIDRRQVLVELTEKGHHLSPQIMPLIAKVYTRFLTDFSVDEALLLQSLLQRLLDNADKP
ncbi:MarR family winged helix-turn-helix transcriptional regulator [Janthinobacterium sp. HLX7-2]|uniref:MarR family winged helix-turn-helix transcriptional regulator n=1 Tax=Janthinobacterium sp. HLX7-2 TaxID=1259331 RepID=UPI003F1F722C